MPWYLLVNCLAVILFTNFEQPQQVIDVYQECRQPAMLGQVLPENPDKKSFKKEEAAPNFNLNASSGAVVLSSNNSLLFEKEADQARPIASITKLMTALVFLEHNPGLNTEYRVRADDHISGGKVNFWSGDTVLVKDLFYTALIASDNVATRALARSTGLSDEDFVKAMNDTAQRLGMFHSRFVEPTGLSNQNVSTAKDLARLVKETLNYPEIKQATTRASYQFETKEGKGRQVVTTDDLLRDANNKDLKLQGGKTGYTNEAGYCFAAAFQSENGEEELISVVLGASSSEDRFQYTQSLVSWVYQYFSWR